MFVFVHVCARFRVFFVSLAFRKKTTDDVSAKAQKTQGTKATNTTSTVGWLVGWLGWLVGWWIGWLVGGWEGSGIGERGIDVLDL